MPLEIAALLLGLTLAADAGTPAALDGTWELDPKVSSELTPLLDYLEVGGLVRAMAPKFVPTQVVTVTAEKLELTVRSTFRSRTTVWPLDGKTPVVDELFDNRTELTSSLVDGAVVSAGTITVKGAAVPMKVRRFIEDGRMVQTTTLEPAGRAPITLRRVFARK
jgi:hypothetical protein